MRAAGQAACFDASQEVQPSPLSHVERHNCIRSLRDMKRIEEEKARLLEVVERSALKRDESLDLRWNSLGRAGITLEPAEQPASSRRRDSYIARSRGDQCNRNQNSPVTAEEMGFARPQRGPKMPPGGKQA